jgi:DNA-binding MarR family transcriptional regulator
MHPLGEQVRATVGRLYRRFRSERPDGELGDTALEVLTWLHKVGPQTLTQLSTQAGVAPGSMSQTVNRLTSAGFATRQGDPDDRRKVLFTTTPAGATLAADARARRNEWLEARLAMLSAQERALVAEACDLLDRVASDAS